MDRRPASAAILACGLTKRYGEVAAVQDLRLAVAPGESYGLLGPNGAGKTSAVHMLSTLIRPDSGAAWVAGHSVLDEPTRVRAAIGVVFQEVALDLSLTAAENLAFAGLLNDMRRRDIRARATQLLELFGLTAVADRRAAALSGGMRRALDIARGLMHRPRVLFLDEPTIGLDVTNRRAIWRHIAALRREMGITVVLTTHYLEEAESCERVGFIDGGRIVREGAPASLIAELGDFVVEVDTAEAARVAKLVEVHFGAATIDGDTVSFMVRGAAPAVGAMQAELAGRMRALRWRRPNLNDVFVHVVRHGGAAVDEKAAA
jgi:ABC-2 type transport system ATP-binding protein